MNKHSTVGKDIWITAGWKADQVSFKDSQIVDQTDKLLNEIISAEFSPTKTAVPHYISFSENIVLLTGMTEQLKRSTGEVSTTLDWFGLGTSATAEDESQTDLQTEDSGGSYARRQISTNGQRKVVNQTAKYGVQWLDSNISAAGIVVREIGLHWHASDPNKCHARTVPTAFTFASGDIYVTRMNETHANDAL